MTLSWIWTIMKISPYSIKSYYQWKKTGYKSETLATDFQLIPSYNRMGIADVRYVENMWWPYKPYFVVQQPETGKHLNLHFFDDGVEFTGSEEDTWFPTEYELGYVRNVLATIGYWACEDGFQMSAFDCLKYCRNQFLHRFDGLEPIQFINGDADRLFKNDPFYLPMNEPMPHWKVPVPPK